MSGEAGRLTAAFEDYGGCMESAPQENAAFSSFFCVIKHFVGHAVCTYDAGFKRHAEVFKHLCGVFHHFPVGIAAHQDPDEGLFSLGRTFGAFVYICHFLKLKTL